MRRLNRREFENSLHDLLSISVPLQHLLPEDGRAQGFDTVAEGPVAMRVLKSDWEEPSTAPIFQSVRRQAARSGVRDADECA